MRRRWRCDGCGRERCQPVPGRTVCTWCLPWVERMREKSDARGMEAVFNHAMMENLARDWPGVFENDLRDYEDEAELTEAMP